MIDPRRTSRLRLTANGRLLDRSIRHAVALQRYGHSLTRDVVGFLNDEVFPDLLGRLTARLDRIRLRGADSGVQSTKRFAGLLDDLAAIIDDGSTEARKKLVRAAQELARVEADWQHNAVRQSVPSEIVPHLGEGIDMRTVTKVVGQPIHGRVMSDWWDGLGADLQKRLHSQIGIGLAQGETTDQLVQRVRGTKARRYQDGVLETTRRQAEAIVRTTVNHVSTQAREETFRDMGDVLKGVQWVSTLDTRTTPICQGRDGKVYPVGEGPRPPAHWNCRSTVVPVTKSWREILGRGPSDVPESTRASMDGQVPEAMTYGEWLGDQPAAVQDMALGRTRGRMFRAGEIQVEQLATPRGRVLTLEELRQQ